MRAAVGDRQTTGSAQPHQGKSLLDRIRLREPPPHPGHDLAPRQRTCDEAGGRGPADVDRGLPRTSQGGSRPTDKEGPIRARGHTDGAAIAGSALPVSSGAGQLRVYRPWDASTSTNLHVVPRRDSDPARRAASQPHTHRIGNLRMVATGAREIRIASGTSSPGTPRRTPRTSRTPGGSLARRGR